MTSKGKWLLAIVIVLVFVIIIYGLCLALAFNPQLSDWFDNATGGNFIFRDDLERMLKFNLINIVAIPAIIILLRVMFDLDFGNKGGD